MKLEIYDFDLYEKDNAAKSVQIEIEPLVNSVEGLWLYREPELRTEGNELPTFTLLSKEYGLIFVKVFEYQDCQLTKIEPKYWEINGKKERSKF